MGLRLAYMGTPDFAVPALKALLDAGHDIVAVYSQPPSKAGRGKKLRPSPVHAFAEERGIEVRTPKSLRTDEAQKAFADLKLDAAIVAAYGLILPTEILEAPRLGCLNIHASLLPRWRGAAPIHRAIMAGDEETGICIMQMDEGLDTGDVLAHESVTITDDMTTAILHDLLAERGAELLVPTLEGLTAGTITPEPQPSEGITYAKKIDKSEARINWHLSATEISRLVRGLNPFPGAWFDVDGQRLKVLAGTVVESNSNAAVGTTLSDQLLIQCGQNAYQVTRAQRAGKGAMDIADLMRGMTIPAGTKLDQETPS